MRLVLVEKLVAEGGPLHVKGDGTVAGLYLADDFKKHQGEAVDGADGLAGLAHGQRGQGVEGTVEQSVAVKEHQQRLSHSLIIAE